MEGISKATNPGPKTITWMRKSQSVDAPRASGGGANGAESSVLGEDYTDSNDQGEPLNAESTTAEFRSQGRLSGSLVSLRFANMMNVWKKYLLIPQVPEESMSDPLMSRFTICNLLSDALGPRAWALWISSV